MAKRPLRRDAGEPHDPPRPCEAAGCADAGEYRAPKSRSNLHEYQWFCLAHVREFNLAWDYYKGMSEAEIEAHLRSDTLGHRPTWPLGRLGGFNPFEQDGYLRDPLGTLRDTPLHQQRRQREGGHPTGRPAGPPPELRAALDVLGLEWPLAQPALRARYKELAKRYHPDANGGDREAEEKLKDVNRAYSLVRQRLAAMAASGQPASAAAE
jgi:DnaJ-domain-containing protein 1